MKTKPRRHSLDTFVQTYKEDHPLEVIPSTKTVYRDIKDALLAIKPIVLPKMVIIQKWAKSKPKTNQKNLGKSIENVQTLLMTDPHLGTGRLTSCLVRKPGEWLFL